MTASIEFLSADDGTLDAFVNAYCDAHGITVDGDAFGLVFSETDRKWSEAEAAAIIENAADIYSLRDAEKE